MGDHVILPLWRGANQLNAITPVGITIIFTRIWVLVPEPKNELHKHIQAASKQKVFISGKQIAPSTDTGRGRKSPPLYCSVEVFNLLKIGVPKWGPAVCSFSHWPCPLYLYQALSNRDFRVRVCSISFMVLLLFFPLDLESPLFTFFWWYLNV